jgi:hypothetical protein
VLGLGQHDRPAARAFARADVACVIRSAGRAVWSDRAVYVADVLGHGGRPEPQYQRLDGSHGDQLAAVEAGMRGGVADEDFDAAARDRTLDAEPARPVLVAPRTQMIASGIQESSSKIAESHSQGVGMMAAVAIAQPCTTSTRSKRSTPISS